MSPTALIGDLCRAVSAWCGRRPAYQFVLLVTLVATVRWGATIGPVFLDMFRTAARVFPQPYGWMDSSMGVIVLMKVFRYPSETVWWWVSLAGFAAAVAVCVSLARRAGQWWRPTLLLIVVSPAFGVLTHLMGHYDYFTLIGTTLATLARRPGWLVVSALFAVLGNPEQVLAAAFCLGVVSIVFPRFRRNATILAVVAIAWLGLLHMLHGQASGRIASAGESILVFTGIRRFLADWPLSLWAFLGPLWLVLLLVVRLLDRRRGLLVVAGVVVIPAAISIVTIDGTRVFVAVSTAALVAVVAQTWRTHWAERPPPAELVGALALTLCLTPGINLFPGAPGLLVQPYDFLLSAYAHWGMTPEKYSLWPRPS